MLHVYKPLTYDPERIKYVDLEKPDNNDIVSDLPLNSFESKYLLNHIKTTIVDPSVDIFSKFKLKRVLRITNDVFEREFEDKKKEYADKYGVEEYARESYGFLTTIKEQMVLKMADSGMKVKMCPYNYLGYNIAGIHICRYLDVALMEASDKLNYDDEVILIVYKYLPGRRKHVPICDNKRLLAPSPGYDSHISEGYVDFNEKFSAQYIKSLEYLYEFANLNYDPIDRPRQCCPIAALTFEKVRPYSSQVNNSMSSQMSMMGGMKQDASSLMRPLQNSYSSASKYPNDLEMRVYKENPKVIDSYDKRREMSQADKSGYRDPWTAHVNAAHKQIRTDLESLNFTASIVNDNMRTLESNAGRKVKAPISRNSFYGEESGAAATTNPYHIDEGDSPSTSRFHSGFVSGGILGGNERERSPISSRLGYPSRESVSSRSQPPYTSDSSSYSSGLLPGTSRVSNTMTTFRKDKYYGAGGNSTNSNSAVSGPPNARDPERFGPSRYVPQRKAQWYN